MMRRYILDGSNITRQNVDDQQPSHFSRAVSLVDALLCLDLNVTCYLDGNEFRRVSPEVAPVLDRCLNHLNPLFIQAVGVEADRLILLDADEEETTRVVSNDSYNDYRNDFPWVRYAKTTPLTERRVVKFSRRGDELRLPGVPEAEKGLLRVPILSNEQAASLVERWCTDGWRQPPGAKVAKSVAELSTPEPTPAAEDGARPSGTFSRHEIAAIFAGIDQDLARARRTGR